MKLTKYKYKKELREKFKKSIYEGLKRRLADKEDQSVLLKNRITELKNPGDALEEKFVLDIDQLLYEKYRQKYPKNIDELSGELNILTWTVRTLRKL